MVNPLKFMVGQGRIELPTLGFSVIMKRCLVIFCVVGYYLLLFVKSHLKVYDTLLLLLPCFVLFTIQKLYSHYLPE